MSKVAELWDTIDRFYESTVPALFKNLNPPASVEQIERLEGAIGFSLPIDLRESYLVHNGSQGTFFEGWALSNLEYVEKSWRFFEQMGDELHPKVNSDSLPDGVQGERAWNRRWLFFLKEVGGREKVIVDCHGNSTDLSGPLFTWDNYLTGDTTISQSAEGFLALIAKSISENTFEIDEGDLILDLF